ncbi:hypothetical protein A1O1_09155 [Capronia coronata CBS 617.96]|uniref:Uncharacterized protein n=1 Tax=Capronia coronata CBS 617.96 TaxID=1182541 RepID=W9XEU6_9EURO|nr:uncharacterized protein A1O1_09155 [Capronia coronata CBS 617.96]EXJ78753.1 hypothetical protein A1O1_09155 [Capronia coronata CBS 617.96]
MSRSIFTSTFRVLSDFLRPPVQTPTPNSAELQGSARQVDFDDVVGQQAAATHRQQGRKRKAEEGDLEVPPLKRGMIEDRHPLRPNEDNPGVDMTQHGANSFAAKSTTGMRKEIERTLMPPPPTPHRFANYRPGQRGEIMSKPGMTTWADEDTMSFASSALRRRKVEDMDDHAMEDARRHAAAIRLPPRSGIWSQTERELFFHLAYRGFEALLPENWMLDFDTLPISLFAQGNAAGVPVIHNVRDNQFRASHALRRLFEIGHDVRDRTYLSPGSRREKVLERAVKRYLYWALTDVGLRPSSRSHQIPVHALVTKRAGLSTLQTLEEIALKLHHLSLRHQRARGLHHSIEDESLHASNVDETRVVADDDSSPTLIGLVIISSVIAIVTLSPFSVQPAQQSIRQTASPPGSEPDINSSTLDALDFNPDRLRIIAELDFSQQDQDVWNALGVAIVAMQIRKEALKANAGLSYDDIGGAGGDAMSIDGSRFDDMDETFGSASKAEAGVDDPDL